MNKSDRKQVDEIKGELENLKSLIEAQGEKLRALADAEQEKFDNMSEGLQGGEKGQAIETAAGYLAEAADACEVGDASGAIEALERIE